MTLDPVSQYRKDLLAMRSYLDGRGYHLAIRALEFARGFHAGVRKDGLTPEFSHQVFIAGYIRTLEASLPDAEAVYVAIFLHDVPEDYDVGFEEIEAMFGSPSAGSVRLLTKAHRGVKLPVQSYYDALPGDPVASVVKGADRGHNILTMSGAGWSRSKQEDYLAEAEQHVLPMLKEARRRHPEWAPALVNLGMLIKVQAKHIRLGLENLAAVEREREARSAPSPA
jgi:(p)ppGpp synthase/HD superfamily hydrolase